MRISELFREITEEFGKVVVGQEETLRLMLVAYLSRGHVLFEGVPGLAKTLMVKALSAILGGAPEIEGDGRIEPFKRVQFTPDMLPSDILGTMVYSAQEGRFRLHRGPIYCHLLLADEINRTPPKTQSALLEAMEERQVTVEGDVMPLPHDFTVFATLNPIEYEGTYPLPEAQLDRFLFKLLVGYSNLAEMTEILKRTTDASAPAVEKVVGGEAVLRGQSLARQVVVAPHVAEYAARLVLATHPGGEGAVADATRFIRYGASPRAAQALVLAGKVRALASGRYNVSFDDIRHFALPALRHRLILNFEGEAEGVTTDQLIGQVLEAVPAATG